MNGCIRQLILLLALLDVITSTRIANDKVYAEVLSENLCFRRFNRTHQTGCQSDAGGNVGVLQLIEGQEDLNLVLKTGQNAPYIPLVDIRDFNVDLLNKFQDSKRVSGVLLLYHNESRRPVSGYSEDYACPDVTDELYQGTEYAQCSKQVWNPVSGPISLMSMDIEFPIFLIKEDVNITRIRNCYHEFNHKKDLENGIKCSAQLESRMTGAKDSVTCITRTILDANSFSGGIKFCDPLGSFNVFSTLLEQPEPEIQKNSVMILAARLDAASMFEFSAMGADSTLSSLIALIAVAKTLRDQKSFIKNNPSQDKSLPKNVLFSLFDGEAFDYIGSGRTAYDLSQSDGLKHYDLFKGREKFNKPIYKGEHIHSILELSQLILHDTNRDYFLHVDPISIQNPSLVDYIHKMKQILKYDNKSSSISIMEASESLPLPPSSVQGLLKHGVKVPAVLLTNHERQFTNLYYNSFLDDLVNSNFLTDRQRYVRYLSELTQQVSKSVLQMITGKTVPSFDVDSQFIEELSECFYVNLNCSLFNQMRGRLTTLPQKTNPFYPLYVSVAYPSLGHYHFEYIRVVEQLMAYVTGDDEDVKSRTDCESLRDKFNYVTFTWFDKVNITNTTERKAVCKRNTRFLTLAVSPVFINYEPDWSLDYSTWTESVWVTPKVRIFISPTTAQQYATLAAGVSIFLLSYILVKMFHQKAELVFIGLRISNNVTVSG